MAQQYVDINNVRGDKMKEKWQRIINNGDDPFDPKHRDKYVEGTVVLETDHWYAFENDHSYEDAEHQLVIVSKEFFADDYDFPLDVWIDLRTIKMELRDKYQITGGGFIQRFGDTTRSGASVVHQHAQILVPKEGKKVAAWFGSGEKSEK